jgi:hypothetical protein
VGVRAAIATSGGRVTETGELKTALKRLTTRLAELANRVVSAFRVGARGFEPPTSRSRTKTDYFAPLTTRLGDLGNLVTPQRGSLVVGGVSFSGSLKRILWSEIEYRVSHLVHSSLARSTNLCKSQLRFPSCIPRTDLLRRAHNPQVMSPSPIPFRLRSCRMGLETSDPILCVR